jgi:hypothetical protein
VSESKNLCLREEEEEELLFLKREPRLHFGNCCRRQVALHAILPTKKERNIPKKKKKENEKKMRDGREVVSLLLLALRRKHWLEPGKTSCTSIKKLHQPFSKEAAAISS